MSARRESDWPEDYLHPGAVEPIAARQRPRRRALLWWEILETALLTLVIFVLVRMLVLNFKVDGLSMTPTLHHEQYLLVNRVAYLSIDTALVRRVWPGADTEPAGHQYLFHLPQRGDIVVFWPPASTERPFIKRVIGLPGELVEVRNGEVIVDGAPLREPYIEARAAYSEPPARVPAGQYFVLGDNRNNSSDSHLFGMLPEEHIIGQAWLSYWPPELVGILPTPLYERQ